MATPELYQFSFSHFNEKVRWALDYKAIPHLRHSLLPGPHIPKVLWLSGQKSVPVLRTGQKIVVGSAEIIDHLEQKFPRRSLYPRSLHARKEALRIQHWLDTEVGPQARRALFYELLPARRFAANTFSQGFPQPLRTAYRLMFPGLSPVFKLDMSITRKGHKLGLAATEKALDYIVETVGEDGYLVDGYFTVADLTAASLLMLTCFPTEVQFRLDAPYPPQLTGWLERWQEHPGTHWIRRIYHRHRGTSAELPLT